LCYEAEISERSANEINIVYEFHNKSLADENKIFDQGSNENSQNNLYENWKYLNSKSQELEENL